MAVFFVKLVSIAVRTLARPLINWVTYYNRLKMQDSKNTKTIFIRNQLVNIGQNFHYYNNWLNRKIFGLSKEQAIKPLSAEKALEKGAELISEFIVYTILLSIPLIEMIRSHKNGNIKEKKKKEFLIQMQLDVDNIVEKNIENRVKLMQLKSSLIQLNSQIYFV